MIFCEVSVELCLSVNSILETSSSENDTDTNWQAGAIVLRLGLHTDTAPTLSSGAFIALESVTVGHVRRQPPDTQNQGLEL